MMTDAEIELEKKYRVIEREGMMCEDRDPTPEQRKIAEDEADEWEFQYRVEQD